MAVLPLLYRNSAGQPFGVQALRESLFMGNDSLTAWINDNSHGAFQLEGTVAEWRKLPADDAKYEGGDYLENGVSKPCAGVCPAADGHALVVDAVALQGATFAWGDFDKDNDGRVDIVVLVQPESGGECPGTPHHIWSHQRQLSKEPGGTVKVKSLPDGGSLVIDDYIVAPALECDLSRVKIGVFAHEFGHSLGLPDLYDTNGETNGASAGLGAWCVMSRGHQGGDGLHPERPVHFSPWAKDQLGWLEAFDATGSTSLKPYETSNEALLLSSNEKMQYLIVNVGQLHFNDTYPARGLAVYQVRTDVVDAQLQFNRVNASASNLGVALIQADNANSFVTNLAYTSGRRDLFPWPPGQPQNFDSSSAPSSKAVSAVCAIPPAAPTASFSVASSARCAAPDFNQPFLPTLETALRFRPTFRVPLANPHASQNYGRLTEFRGKLSEDGTLLHVESGWDVRVRADSALPRSLAAFGGKKVRALGAFSGAASDELQIFALGVP